MQKLILVALVIFQSILPGTLNAQEGDAIIPLNLRKYTLLIMKAEQGIMQKAFNSKLQKALEENYTGPFLLVGKKDMEELQYADTSIYRYVLDVIVLDKTSHITEYRRGSEVERRTSRTTYDVDIFFFDRVKNKKLPHAGFVSGSYISSVRELGKYLKKSNF